MKIKIFAIMVLLVVIGMVICPFLCSAQVIQLEIGSNTKGMQQASLTAGYINFKDDSFTGGVVYKRYGDVSRTGFRMNVNITLAEWLSFYTVSDVFLDPDINIPGHTFLEIGAGLMLIYKGFQVSGGYQMNDYNPSTKVNREDQPLVRVGYRINLNN